MAAYFPRGCGGRNPATMLRLYRTQRRRRNILGRYRAILVATRHMADEFSRHGVASACLHVVPLFAPGVRSDPAPPTEKPRSNRVLFIGRITLQKGLRHLIAAMPRAAADLGRPLTLVVAGDGPDRTASESAAKLARIPNEFLGWVNPDRLLSEMRAADILAVPSVWPEPFGLIGIEAGNVGLPAVAYAVGGIPDWLKSGVSGESAPGEHPNPVQLACALVRALSDDGHLQHLRLGAWQTAGTFSAERHVQRLDTLLRKAAA